MLFIHLHEAYHAAGIGLNPVTCDEVTGEATSPLESDAQQYELNRSLQFNVKTLILKAFEL